MGWAAHLEDQELGLVSEREEGREVAGVFLVLLVQVAEALVDWQWQCSY